MSRLDQTKYISRSFFLKKIIRGFYSRRPLEEPTDLHKREIALESLEDEAYIRHLSFPYMAQLYEYILKTKTPLHLYYSSALYTNPSADRMENKNWEGSELMFDIDSDKYPDCQYTQWICPSTGDISVTEIEKCPGGDKPVEYTYIPWTCITRAWRDVQVLIDILRDDFGFKSIKVYFSGNRGFHVKVYDGEVLTLTRESRKTIADYIACEGLLRDRVFPEYKGKVLFIPPEHGIRGRVYRIALERGLLEKSSTRDLKDVYTLPTEQLDTILGEICVKIDKAVTMDTSRLSRFGNSLNMKAGLKVTEIDPNKDVENLSYRDLSPFKGYLKIKPMVSGTFNVLDTTVSLTRGGELKVEAYVGIYLVIKNIAQVINMDELEVKP